MDAELCGEILCNASSNGHIRIVHLILKNGGDVHFDCGRALFLAAIHNHLAIVTLLIHQGATSGYAEIESAAIDGNHHCLGLLMPSASLSHSQLEQIIGIAGATAAAIKITECAQIVIRYSKTKYLIELITKKSKRDYEENPGLNIIQKLALKELHFRRSN